MHYKQLYRYDAKNKISKLTKEQINEKSKKIFDSLLKLDEFLNARHIMCYMSKENEVDTRPIFEYAFSKGISISAPRCSSTDEGIMESYAVGKFEDFREGRFGIMEPRYVMPRAPKGTIEVIIVPGLAYSILGERIGKGGGYYDRYLAESNSFLIGLCFDECLYEILPEDPHDIKMDAVISDERTIVIAKRN